MGSFSGYKYDNPFKLINYYQFMVKLVEKSQEERERELNVKKLENITKEFIPTGYEVISQGYLFSVIKKDTPSKEKKRFDVLPAKSMIYLYNTDIFVLAFNLAQEFEKKGELEYTFKERI